MEASAYKRLLSDTSAFISPGSFPPKFPPDSQAHGQLASHCYSCSVKTGPSGSVPTVSLGIENLSQNSSCTLPELEGQNNGGLTVGGDWR